MITGRRQEDHEVATVTTSDDGAARLALALVEAVAEVEQLRSTLATRAVIGQAQGLLMAWLDIDADQAFTHLQRASNHQNRKLRDIAAEVVRTRQRPNE